MKYLWHLESAYMKNLIEAYPEPKPASTTVATLLKRMQAKGYVAFRQHGSVREYYPLLEKDEYFKGHLKGLIRNFFDNSAGKFASFFTTATELSDQELEELKKIVDQEIKKRKS